MRDSHFLLVALLNTRGTGEPQGESAGFTTMNGNVLNQLPGGKIVRVHGYLEDEILTFYQYNTVYPAAADQNSASGTQDVCISPVFNHRVGDLTGSVRSDYQPYPDHIGQ